MQINTINTILGKFTKSELLEKCPSIAKSTLEATLKKLVDEGFIKKNNNKITLLY